MKTMETVVWKLFLTGVLDFLTITYFDHCRRATEEKKIMKCSRLQDDITKQDLTVSDFLSSLGYRLIQCQCQRRRSYFFSPFMIIE